MSLTLSDLPERRGKPSTTATATRAMQGWSPQPSRRRVLQAATVVFLAAGTSVLSWGGRLTNRAWAVDGPDGLTGHLNCGGNDYSGGTPDTGGDYKHSNGWLAACLSDGGLISSHFCRTNNQISWHRSDTITIDTNERYKFEPVETLCWSGTNDIRNAWTWPSKRHDISNPPDRDFRCSDGKRKRQVWVESHGGFWDTREVWDTICRRCLDCP